MPVTQTPVFQPNQLQRAVRKHNNLFTRFATLLRELAANAHPYIINDQGYAYVADVVIDGKTAVWFHHDGLPFQDLDNIKNAFKMNNTIGTGGIQGSGGKIVPLMLINDYEDYEYIIHSNCQDGRRHTARLKIKPNSNHMLIEDISDEYNTKIQTLYGSENTPNVVYLIKTTTKGKSQTEGNVSVTAMMNVMNFAPSALDNHDHTRKQLNISFHSGKPVGPGRTYPTVLSTTPLALPSKTDFDHSFLFESLTTHAKNISVEILGNTVTLDTILRLDVYHGLKAEGKALVHMKGVNKGQASRCLTPSQASFLTYSGFPKKDGEPVDYTRLRKDPIWTRERANDWFQDLGIILPNTSENAQCNQDKIQAVYPDDTTKVVKAHKPFGIITVEIERIVSVINDKGETQDPNKAFDPFRYIGGFDECFYTETPNECHQIVRETVSRVRDIDPPALRSFREKLKDILPEPTKPNRLMLPLTSSKDSTSQSVEVYDLQGNRVLRLQPGQVIQARLRLADGTNLTEPPEILGNGLVVTKVQATDYFLLYASPLSKLDDHGNPTPVPEEDYRQTSQFVPKKNYKVRALGITRRLNLDIVIPTGVAKGRSGPGDKADKAPGNEHERLSNVDTYTTLNNSTVFGEFSQTGEGVYRLNETEPRVTAIANLDGHRHPVLYKKIKDLYITLTDQARFVADVESQKISQFTDKAIAQLQETYEGSDANAVVNYTIDQYVQKLLKQSPWQQIVQKVVDIYEQPDQQTTDNYGPPDHFNSPYQSESSQVLG